MKKKIIFIINMHNSLCIYSTDNEKLRQQIHKAAEKNGNYTEEEYERIYSSREHIKNMIVKICRLKRRDYYGK